MHSVKKVKYLEEYKIILTFEDKKNKLVDLKDHLEGEIFEPLKDISYFKQIYLNTDIDTIMWDNGADMSPDFLYEIGKDIKK
jgi:hypothetical protein